ncbi:MAG TPA: DUF6777 domain-containing protein [Micromonosporaceae bacterium]
MYRNLIALLLLALGVAGCVAPAADGVVPSNVRLERIGTAGPHPFMPTMGTDELRVIPPPNSGRDVGGDLVGLYGAVSGTGSCHTGAMVDYLRAHPEVAIAWAAVARIAAADIAAFMDDLTPAVLRSDTYVVSHQRAGDRVTGVPTVLQAGTAVLVDRFGSPVVRCLSGNPLTRPTRRPTGFAGQPWPHFSATAITVITPASGPVDRFTMVNLDTGDALDRPRGSDGDRDRPPSAQPR